MRLLCAEETSVIEVPSSPLLSPCSLQQQTAGKPWTSRFSQVGDARSIGFLLSFAREHRACSTSSSSSGHEA